MDVHRPDQATAWTGFANFGGSKSNRSGNSDGSGAGGRWHDVWTDPEIGLRGVLPLRFVWMRGAFGHLASSHDR
jgi:hypothetical protein